MSGDESYTDEMRRATAAIARAENALRDAADDVERYLREGFVGLKHTRAEFPTIHLLSRSVADLRAGMLLAGSGFVIQMCSVIRHVRESLDLIELFDRKPERAEEWLAGATDFWKWRPKAVRKELGKPDDDPVYAWLSQRSHPRLEGAEASAYMTEGGETVLVIMGGLPLNDPQVLIAASMPGDLLGSVAFAAGHFVTKAEAAVKWPAMLVSVTERLQEGAKGILDFLHAGGVPTDSIGQRLLDAYQANVDSARALRDAVDEAVAREGL